MSMNWSNKLFINICSRAVPSVHWHCWLGGRKSIRPVKNWVMRCLHGYLSGAKCKWFAYGPADATATPSFLASLKSRMIYLSGAGLLRLSQKKVVKWVSSHGLEKKQQFGIFLLASNDNSSPWRILAKSRF